MHFYFIKSQEYSLIMKIVCYYGVEFVFYDLKNKNWARLCNISK